MPRPDKNSGHALVEVLLLGLLLLVPVIWMLTVFAELHAAALGATSAAREAGFEAARSGDALSADRAVARVVHTAIVDHGLDPGLVDVTWAGAPGWRRGGTVEVLVTYRVPVLQAPLLGRITEPTLAVSARHVVTVDRYRSRSE